MSRKFYQEPCEIRVNCKILNFFFREGAPDDSVAWNCIVQPVGTDETFIVTELFYTKDMFESIGKIVSADLTVRFSRMEFTEESQARITDLSGQPLGQHEERGFCAIGQYLGNISNTALIQSAFVFTAEDNLEATQGRKLQIGDWVVVRGQFQIYWEHRDIYTE